jgi:hypothetical protein
MIRNRIEQNRLSDEEALYWRRIDGESPGPAGQEPLEKETPALP